MAFWKLCKNGNLNKDKKGEFVDRLDYDNLLRENRNLRKTLTLDNFSLMCAYLIENEELNSSQKLAILLYFNSVQAIIRQMKSDNLIKSELFQEQSKLKDKEEVRKV
jgi:hypothetical protein